MWKSNFGRPTPSTRCCLRNCVSSMAWRLTKVSAIDLRMVDCLTQVGAWPSEKSFQRECDCQALAAKSNSAPAVRARAWAGGAAGVGAIVMDRLTCPSFHVWLLYGRGVPGCLHAIDATRVHLTMKWVVSFSILSNFGPRRGRRGVSERTRSRRWRLRDRAAATASTRRHATATPTTWL